MAGIDLPVKELLCIPETEMFFFCMPCSKIPQTGAWLHQRKPVKNVT